MFVRTLLAMSLSCIIAGTAFAAPIAEQPLNPKKIADTAVQDPIDPLATNAASSAQSTAETQITQQEQQDLNKASKTLQDLEKSEDDTAAIGAAPTTSTATTSSSVATKASWTLDGLNNAGWYETNGKGQFPVYARAHVVLNNAHASPGAIDGSSGKNTL